MFLKKYIGSFFLGNRIYYDVMGENLGVFIGVYVY